MAHSFLRSSAASALLALACLAVPASAQGLADTTGASAAQEAGAFDLRIQAPEAVARLLEQHLELQRYRALSDLSDSEIQSLMVSAQQDASDLLATLGYFAANIRIRLLPADATARKVVQIDVETGPVARVAAVNLVLEGAIAQDPDGQTQRQSVQDLWALASGEPFSQAAWDNAKQLALKQLVAKRYATARVVDSRAEVHPETQSVDLELRLDSGPAYQIGSLEVQGTERYSRDMVQRFARLQPGDAYELSKLVEAQQRLTDSGYYDSAYLSLDTRSDPAQAVVQAQVKEALMQKLVFGVGASTDAGARWSAEHTYNQVPGIDWRAVNKVQVARNSKSFASDWTSQPSDSRWRWASSALFQQDTIGAIEVNTERYRAGRFTSDTDLDQSYFLQYESATATYQEIGQSIVNAAASANYAFALRSFDSTPFPTSGWGVGGELSAGSILGSEQEPYARFLLRARAYQPLGLSESNLFLRQHAGRMVYRAQVGAVLVNESANVPFSQLFLTGGDTTVRGYKLDEIGVSRDGLLTAESGRYVATGGVEWQRPIVRNGLMTDWESAVFIDTGAVANRTEEFSFKVGVGVGARWKSPIGPLQIDVAYGVATEALRLHLNVGFVF
jgi:translocation and assembly module TamA